MTKLQERQIAANGRKYALVRAEIAKGMPIAAAIKKAGMSIGTYYNTAKRVAKTPSKGPRSPRKLLNIIDLPEQVSQPGLFMVWGSPKTLAEFAKGMQ